MIQTSFKYVEDENCWDIICQGKEFTAYPSAPVNGNGYSKYLLMDSEGRREFCSDWDDMQDTVKRWALLENLLRGIDSE